MVVCAPPRLPLSFVAAIKTYPDFGLSRQAFFTARLTLTLGLLPSSATPLSVSLQGQNRTLFSQRQSWPRLWTRALDKPAFRQSSTNY